MPPDFSAGPLGSKVERAELLDRIRAEASERRGAAGPTRVPALEDARTALRATLAEAAPRAEASLRRDPVALADPMAVDLHSHRRLTGSVVLGVKRTVLRLLTSVLTRQGRFNAEACAEVRDFTRRVDEARLTLEARLDAVEWRASQASGRLAPAYPTFDYDAFENAFRGAIEDQRAALAGYLPLLRESPGPVLDLGCGRGELLALLREEGVSGRGVDLDDRAVAAARARGLEVVRDDVIAALRGANDESLGAVVALQVIEHLTLRVLGEVLGLARRKLRSGGILLLETVNVSSGYALAHGWTIDPTHRLRLHPRVLEALIRGAGFRTTEILLRGEVTSCDRMERGSPPAPDALRLEWLYAPQDCALVARV